MGEFQHGLFGCFGDCKVCIITYFVPCYTEGKIAESVGESCLLHCLVMFVPLLNLFCMCQIRGKVREQRNIEGSGVGDCLAVWCCAVCALCQEAQETNALGQGMVVEQDIERA